MKIQLAPVLRVPDCLELHALEFFECGADRLHFLLGALLLLVDELERVGEVVEATNGFAIRTLHGTEIQ